MKQDLRDKRKEYKLNEIDYNTVPKNPIQLFEQWYSQAQSSEQIVEPYAMSLSTVEEDGFPRNRVVLLKEFDNQGFVFYTNYNSRKGKAIEANPKVCLSFFWDKLEQQVIIKGLAARVDEAQSDEYFHQRPYASQIGAIVSEQSSVIGFEHDLQLDAEKVLQKYKGTEVPRPKHWGGYRVTPLEIEFWQGRPSRLHDRLFYKLEDDKWVVSRLYP